MQKGAGSDGIPNKVLVKAVFYGCCDPLVLIFNKSLTTGTFPEIRKNSFVIPIFKSGNKSDVSKYREVAIISATPMFFEILVYKVTKKSLTL